MEKFGIAISFWVEWSLFQLRILKYPFAKVSGAHLWGQFLSSLLFNFFNLLCLSMIKILHCLLRTSKWWRVFEQWDWETLMRLRNPRFAKINIFCWWNQDNYIPYTLYIEILSYLNFEDVTNSAFCSFIFKDHQAIENLQVLWAFLTKYSHVILSCITSSGVHSRIYFWWWIFSGLIYQNCPRIISQSTIEPIQNGLKSVVVSFNEVVSLTTTFKTVAASW